MKLFFFFLIFKLKSVSIQFWRIRLHCMFMFRIEFSLHRATNITHRNEYDVYRTNVRVLLKFENTWISGTVYNSENSRINQEAKREKERERRDVRDVYAMCRRIYQHFFVFTLYAMCIYGNIYGCLLLLENKQRVVECQ